ncbi:hypothetical protein PIB30_048305 [Stylosanthes scabra]|uniref:Uncharacterized protein n=1 Tax=Stylosanthes scabra TaxID=79078 RepID=A0ABU6WGY8_9FABA|nr:hypothetical protein [Stylosanthes scabra]
MASQRSWSSRSQSSSQWRTLLRGWRETGAESFWHKGKPRQEILGLCVQEECEFFPWADPEFEQGDAEEEG